MEGVEGMLRGLKLSEVERRGVRIGGLGGRSVGAVEVQAVGKLLAEKPAYAEAMANALGPLWCLLKGIACKHLGDKNYYSLFTRHQV
jgi:hypothetical protein